MLLPYLIEENTSLSVLDILKKDTVKDVIYWVAQSQQNTSVNLLRRSLKKVWPRLEFEKTPIPTPVTQDDGTELLHLVQQEQCCEDVAEG